MKNSFKLIFGSGFGKRLLNLNNKFVLEVINFAKKIIKDSLNK
jgi:hypothetical protein